MFNFYSRAWNSQLNPYLCIQIRISMRKELGKVLIDIAKLVIGGVILAGLMRQDIPPVFLFVAGSIVSVLMIGFGLGFIMGRKRQ